MSVNPSPTVRRRRLALELRRLREAARLTCEDVAERLECSASKISRVETGRVSVSPRDVRDLLEIYGVPEDERDGLVQLARDSRQKGWWHAFGEAVEPHFATYLGLEGAASEIRTYRITRVPILLQTADYARATMIAEVAARPHARYERLLDLQLERQRQAMTNMPRLWAVLDEAALHRQVGGPEVMRAQLEYLREAAESPDVHLQIVPFSQGRATVDLPYIILAFPDPLDPEVVCIRYQTGILWVEDINEVDRYNRHFHHLLAAALSFDDSIALVTSILKEL